MPPESDTKQIDPILLDAEQYAALVDQFGDVGHIDQYFGPWAIHEERFQALIAGVVGLDLRRHIDAEKAKHQQEGPSASSFSAGYTNSGGVAVINMIGPMTKYASSLADGGTSTIRVKRAIRNAVADDDVSAIVLRIDSPGGTVSGTAELAAEVASAKDRKPTIAVIQDWGASAAYWVASQASKVYATNQTTLIGAIGTYGVIRDFSAQGGQLGIETHLVSAGPFKGMGTPGTKVTPDHLAYYQQMIDGLNEQFVLGVVNGRRMTSLKVRDLADGRVHLAAKAIVLGLIDGVQTLDATIYQFSTNKDTRGVQMSTETTQDVPVAELQVAPRAATHTEIKAACPGADAAFVIAQLDANATVAQVTTAWMARQNEVLAKQKEELARQKEELAAQKAAPDRPGLPKAMFAEGGKGAPAADGGDAMSEFCGRVQKKVEAGMSKGKAIRAVSIEDPELRQTYQEAYKEASNEDRLRP